MTRTTARQAERPAGDDRRSPDGRAAGIPASLGRSPPAPDLAQTTIHDFPHAFIDKRGEPMLIWLLTAAQRQALVEMYMAYQPRNSFSGLPPLNDEVCHRWATGIVRDGISLVAMSLEAGLAAHGALFPIDEEACDMLVVVWPRHQMIGIGTELTHCLIQLAHELGFSSIKLNVEAHNHVARHVYEKCGFHCTGVALRDELDMSIDLGQYRRRTNIPVGEIMNRRVISIGPDMPCRVAMMIFLADRISSIPVINERDELLGIVSQSDLLVEANIGKKVADVLTREVVSVREGCTLARVISLFRSRKLRQIPVLDRDGKLIGIVSRREVLAYFLKRFGGCRE